MCRRPDLVTNLHLIFAFLQMCHQNLEEVLVAITMSFTLSCAQSARSNDFKLKPHRVLQNNSISLFFSGKEIEPSLKFRSCIRSRTILFYKGRIMNEGGESAARIWIMAAETEEGVRNCG